MPKPIVLYVDDDQANLDTFKRVFRFDYDVRVALSGIEGLKVVQTEPELALIVTDQRMPQMTGIAFLKEALQLNPHPQRIILTAFTDNDALLKAIQEGHVYDYVVKPWEPSALKAVCDKAIAIYYDRMEKIKRLISAEAKTQALKEDIKEKYNLDEIIGWDGGLSNVTEQVKKVSASPATVLIRGETGTGKELIARAIHNLSSRKDDPFVAVHCAALSAGVLESELFGHVKGAFTGAIADKKGRFELANNGTLFLDEIGDLPDTVQVKLLRVLQERIIERVGGVDGKKVNVRLVAATHKPLEEMVKAGKFRQDLFFRLNVIPITLPPLRERQEDILKLAEYFLLKFNRELGKSLTFEPQAVAALSEYDWPGNVRELQNAVERAVVLCEDSISADDLFVGAALCGLPIREGTAQPCGRVQPLPYVNINNIENIFDKINDEESKKIANALQKAKGNISEAARALGLARSTLMHKLKKFKLV